MIAFFVAGLPRPAGSKRAFPIKKNGVFTGKTAVADSNPKAKDWKCDVAHAAAKAMEGKALLTGPVKVEFTFCMPRPKYQFRKDGSLKYGAPYWHTVKPDALKLARGVEDALTGIVWNDDSQIVDEHLIKAYAAPSRTKTIGVHIQVSPLL